MEFGRQGPMVSVMETPEPLETAGFGGFWAEHGWRLQEWDMAREGVEAPCHPRALQSGYPRVAPFMMHWKQNWCFSELSEPVTKPEEGGMVALQPPVSH